MYTVLLLIWLSGCKMIFLKKGQNSERSELDIDYYLIDYECDFMFYV